jgi:hypothetical protein
MKYIILFILITFIKIDSYCQINKQSEFVIIDFESNQVIPYAYITYGNNESSLSDTFGKVKYSKSTNEIKIVHIGYHSTILYPCNFEYIDTIYLFKSILLQSGVNNRFIKNENIKKNRLKVETNSKCLIYKYNRNNRELTLDKITYSNVKKK